MKHLASPATLSIKRSSSGSAAFHLSLFVRLHNRRFESWGEVGFAVPSEHARLLRYVLFEETLGAAGARRMTHN